MGDQWIKATLAQILVPCSYTGFQPEWVGVGQVTLYGLAVIGLSFYVRPWIGRDGWRAIHFLSFAAFIAALAHGVMSGSDSAALAGMYWGTGASVLFLTIYRVLVSIAGAGQRRSVA
jgi:predicted ferric reductase